MINTILKKSKYILPVLVLLSCNNPDLKAQKKTRILGGATKVNTQFPNSSKKSEWVDSVYHELSLKEKIGQLFMVAAYSGGKNYNFTKIQRLVKNQKIGGLIYMQGTAEAQAKQTNILQASSKVPLMLGMDAEWGVGMRLRGVKNFPRQMTLGGAQDEKLVYQMGALVAKQCKLLGVHVNFAPDIDVNNNPRNPIINFRSFGQDKVWVSKLGTAYMNGMQDNGIYACAKHFPGHGDVETDSHLDLPTLNKSKAALDDLELYPFRYLIDKGVKSIMIAHLNVPSLEKKKRLPTTLSLSTVTKTLKGEMGFKGLIFTDALNMQGVAKYYSVGTVDLMAFKAGNDVLLFSQNVQLAINKIHKEIQNGQISEERLAHSVKKILAAKYDVGLHKRRTLPTVGLTAKLNRDVSSFTRKAARGSVTLVKDNNKLLSKTLNSKLRVAFIGINSTGNSFYRVLKSKFPNAKKISTLKQARGYDVVIAGVHKVNKYPGKGNRYGVNYNAQKVIKQIARYPNVMIAHFGNAYATKYACNASSMLVAYEENYAAYQAVVDVLSGSLKPKGVMPVNACQ